MLCTLCFSSSAQVSIQGKVSLLTYLQNLETKFQVVFSFTDPLVQGVEVEGVLMNDLFTCLEQVLYPVDIDFAKISSERIALFPMQVLERSGFVLDSKSKEPLIGAHIYHSRSGQGVITDENGFFRLFARRIDSLHMLSYIGYQPKILNSNQHRSSVILLDPSTDLNPVVVLGKDLSQVSKYTLQQDELQILNAKLFEQLPSLGAEPDIMQYASTVPGVHLGTDGVSGLRVRGGSTDQNRISIDQVPVYYPYHVLGYKSIFNAFDIGQIGFSKSGFSASQQGRLSSYFNIDTRDPSLSSLRFQSAFGTPLVQGSVEGPLVKNRTAIKVSARSSLFGSQVQDLSRDFYDQRGTMGQYDFNFTDYLAKIIHKSRTGNNIWKGLFLYSKDQFMDEIDYSFVDKNESILDFSKGVYAYDNRLGYLSWDHYFTGKWQLNAKAYFSEYAYTSRFNNDYAYENRLSMDESFDWRYTLNFQSDLSEYGLKHTWRHQTGDWDIQFGFDGAYLTYNNGIRSRLEQNVLNDPESSVSDDVGEQLQDQSWNTYLFFQFMRTFNQWDISFNLAFNHFRNHIYHTSIVIPRLSIQRLLNKNTLLFLNIDRNVQNQHVLALSYSGLPNEIWVPANEYVPEQTSTELTLGTKHRTNRWYFSIESYYKWLHGLIDLSDQAISLNESILDQISLEFWDAYVDFGDSRNLGLECSIQHQGDRWYNQLNYTWSSAIRQFDNKYAGYLVDYEFNPRHQIALQSIWKPMKKWSFGLTWVFTSHNYLSLTEGSYDVISGESFIEQIDVQQDEFVQYVLPTFHRLNLGINFSSTGKHLKHEVKVSASNVYNLTNFTTYKIFNQIDARDSFATIRLFESLPFLPSLYYRIIF